MLWIKILPSGNGLFIIIILEVNFILNCYICYDEHIVPEWMLLFENVFCEIDSNLSSVLSKPFWEIKSNKSKITFYFLKLFNLYVDLISKKSH